MLKCVERIDAGGCDIRIVQQVKLRVEAGRDAADRGMGFAPSAWPNAVVLERFDAGRRIRGLRMRYNACRTPPPDRVPGASRTGGSGERVHVRGRHVAVDGEIPQVSKQPFGSRASRQPKVS